MRPFLLGYDFFYYWASGRLLRNGGNPYDINQLEQQLRLIGWPADEAATGLPNPPISLWMYWLMAMMPFQIALHLWNVGSLIACVLCGIALNRKLMGGRALSTQLAIIGTLVFPPVISNFFWGQINAIPLLGLFLFGHFFQRKAAIAAGFWLSLTLCKPHAVLALLLALTTWELIHRRVALIGGLVLGICAQGFATYLINPNAFSWYFTHGTQVIAQASRICGATLAQTLVCETDWAGFQVIAPLLGTVACVMTLMRYNYSLRTIFCLLLPISSLSAPYGWSHTAVTLLPAFLMAVRSYRECVTERGAMYGLAVLGLLAIPISLIVTIQREWIALPLILLLVNIRAFRLTDRRVGQLSRVSQEGKAACE